MKSATIVVLMLFLTAALATRMQMQDLNRMHVTASAARAPTDEVPEEVETVHLSGNVVGPLRPDMFKYFAYYLGTGSELSAGFWEAKAKAIISSLKGGAFYGGTPNRLPKDAANVASKYQAMIEMMRTLTPSEKMLLPEFSGYNGPRYEAPSYVRLGGQVRYKCKYIKDRDLCIKSFKYSQPSKSSKVFIVPCIWWERDSVCNTFSNVHGKNLAKVMQEFQKESGLGDVLDHELYKQYETFSLGVGIPVDANAAQQVAASA